MNFAVLAFSEIHPPNILRHHDRGCASRGFSCALSSSVKGVFPEPGLSTVSGPPGASGGASISGIRLVSAAMIRRFSLLASRSASSCSRSVALCDLSSVRTGGESP
jgi:hypothetical protein